MNEEEIVQDTEIPMAIQEVTVTNYDADKDNVKTFGITVLFVLGIIIGLMVFNQFSKRWHT